MDNISITNNKENMYPHKILVFIVFQFSPSCKIFILKLLAKLLVCFQLKYAIKANNPIITVLLIYFIGVGNGNNINNKIKTIVIPKNRQTFCVDLEYSIINSVDINYNI